MTDVLCAVQLRTPCPYEAAVSDATSAILFLMKRYRPILYRLSLLYFLILTVLLAVELNFSIDAQFVVTLGNVMLALMVVPAVGILRTGRRNPWLRLVVCSATVFLWAILIFFYSCTPTGTTSLPVRMCQSGLFDLLYPAILYIGAAAGALIPIGIAFLIYRDRKSVV